MQKLRNGNDDKIAEKFQLQLYRRTVDMVTNM